MIPLLASLSVKRRLIKDLKFRGGPSLRSGAIRQRFGDDVGIGDVDVGKSVDVFALVRREKTRLPWRNLRPTYGFWKCSSRVPVKIHSRKSFDPAMLLILNLLKLSTVWPYKCATGIRFPSHHLRDFTGS